MKKQMLLVSGISTILAGVIAGCGTTTPSSSASSKPLATVNGTNITNSDLSNLTTMTTFLDGSPLPKTNTVKLQEVKYLVQQNLVSKWTLSKKLITNKQAQSQAQALITNQLEAQVGGKAKLLTLLKQKHITLSQLTQYLTKQMVMAAAYKHATASVKAPSTAQAQSYYNSHKSQFAGPTEANVSEIVVKTQSQANTLANQIKKGTSFSTLAKKDSIVKSSAQKGGALGWLPETPGSGMSFPVYSAVKKSHKGQVQVLKGTHGYDVIRLNSTKAGTVASFKSSEKQIKTNLQQTQKNSVFQSFSSNLQKHAKVHIYFK